MAYESDQGVDAYFEAHERYQGYRDAAFDVVWNAWNPELRGVDLKIHPINREALQFWSAIWVYDPLCAEYAFPWDQIYDQNRTTPRRLDAAIWDGTLLCGLCAGRASRGSDNVTLRFIERWGAEENALAGQIAAIATDIADAYAKILGKQRVKLKNPVDGALPHYAGLRFSLAETLHGSTYWHRPVE